MVVILSRHWLQLCLYEIYMTLRIGRYSEQLLLNINNCHSSFMQLIAEVFTGRRAVMRLCSDFVIWFVCFECQEICLWYFLPSFFFISLSSAKVMSYSV